MNFHRRVEHFRHDEREEIGLRPEARRTDAEALLAELKSLLDEEQAPISAAQAASGKGASAAFSTLWELGESDGASGAAAPSEGEGEVEGKSGTSSGDQLSGVERIVAERPFPIDQSVRLSSQKWKLLVSGLALSVVTATGAGLVFKGGVPDLLRNSSPVAKTPAPAPVRPAMAVAPAPAEAGGFAMKDEPGLAHAQVGGPEPDLQSKAAPAGGDSSPTAPTAVPQFSADSAAAAKTLSAPTTTEPAAAAATAVSQPQRREPPQDVMARPEEAPEATGALTSNASAASGATGLAAPAAVKPHPRAASRAEVSAEPARPARNAWIKSAKRTDHKTAAKKAKATGKAAVEAPKQRLDAATPNAAAAEQPAAAAAPPSATPNEQQQGGVAGAFGYLMHLPAALIQRAINPNEAK